MCCNQEVWAEPLEAYLKRAPHNLYKYTSPLYNACPLPAPYYKNKLASGEWFLDITNLQYNDCPKWIYFYIMGNQHATLNHGVFTDVLFTDLQ